VFTVAVAALFRAFGESLVVGRIPAVLGGVGLTVIVFVAVLRYADRTSAWLAALLVCFAPVSIYLSQQVRFYSIQAFCFWLGALAVFAVVATGEGMSGRRRATALLVAGAAWVLAIHVQVISLIPIAATLAWAVAAWAWFHVRGEPTARQAWTTLALVLAIASLGALAVAGLGGPSLVLARFQQVDAWALHQVGNIRFYHYYLLGEYALLWALFPVFAVVALVRFPLFASFVLTAFGFTLALHSVAAWKHFRYVFSVIPGFFIVAAIGVATIVVPLWALVSGAIDRRLSPVPARRMRHAAAAALVAAGLFAVASMGFSSYTVRMIVAPDAEWRFPILYRGEPQWESARPALVAARAEADVLVASAELKALYYLGDVDYILHETHLLRGTERDPDFTLFRKVNRPVFSGVAALAQVVQCYRSGLVVIEENQWRQPWGVPPATADVLEAGFESVELPDRSRLRAFRWRDSGEPVPEPCPPGVDTEG
jgi:hypothetical protein